MLGKPDNVYFFKTWYLNVYIFIKKLIRLNSIILIGTYIIKVTNPKFLSVHQHHISVVFIYLPCHPCNRLPNCIYQRSKL